MKDATLLVKTCYRPVKLARLVQSVRRYYPDMPVVVVDDGPQDGPWRLPEEALAAMGNVRTQVFPSDIGIGYCYNWAVREAVRTKFVVLGDDDELFTSETRLEVWEPWISNGLWDLVGGAVKLPGGRLGSSYVGRVHWKDEPPGLRSVWLQHYRPMPTEEPVRCDYCPNFWIAATETLLRTPWDETLKVCRHADFFLQGMARKVLQNVLYHPGVAVLHDHASAPADPPEYRWRRSGRYQEFVRLFEAKWGLVAGGLHE